MHCWNIVRGWHKICGGEYVNATIMMKKTILLSTGLIIFLILISSFKTYSQQFYRVKAEYSIKYKDTKGNQILQMGVTFYDTNAKIVVMKNGFPVREILAQKDTAIFQVRNEKLVGTSHAYSLPDLSIFHMALTGELNNFGLDKAGYHLENVKSDKGLILTTWSPPDEMKKNLGKILVSTKEKKLFGIVFLDTNEKIVAKHLFQNYQNINGFVFPMVVLRITYAGDEESYKRTEYKNIKVNETGKDEGYYNYKIPEKKN